MRYLATVPMLFVTLLSADDGVVSVVPEVTLKAICEKPNGLGDKTFAFADPLVGNVTTRVDKGALAGSQKKLLGNWRLKVITAFIKDGKVFIRGVRIGKDKRKMAASYMKELPSPQKIAAIQSVDKIDLMMGPFDNISSSWGDQTGLNSLRTWSRFCISNDGTFRYLDIVLMIHIPSASPSKAQIRRLHIQQCVIKQERNSEIALTEEKSRAVVERVRSKGVRSKNSDGGLD